MKTLLSIAFQDRGQKVGGVTSPQSILLKNPPVSESRHGLTPRHHRNRPRPSSSSVLDFQSIFDCEDDDDDEDDSPNRAGAPPFDYFSRIDCGDVTPLRNGAPGETRTPNILIRSDPELLKLLSLLRFFDPAQLSSTVFHFVVGHKNGHKKQASL